MTRNIWIDVRKGIKFRTSIPLAQLAAAFRVLFFTASFLIILSKATLAQVTPTDIKPEHWAYIAVQDLALKGLIKGYPPDGNFLGGRNVTRYEIATILKRVLDRMDEILKQSHSEKATDPAEFSKLKSSMGEISELIAEFKTQLIILGMDMVQAKSSISTLKSYLGLQDRVSNTESRISGLSKKVDAEVLAVDQSLENLVELKSSTAASLAKKVDVSTGSLRVTGNFQVWFGTTLAGTFSGLANNISSSTMPVGRSFGGSPGDTFRVRRGEIGLLGSITRNVDYKIQFDASKTGTGVNAPLKDLWIGYQLNPQIRLEVGQQKTGLTEEGTRSSTKLLTIERAIMNTLPANAGLVGNARDTGIMLRYKSPRFEAFAGIWNDNGLNQNVVDSNRLKFLSGGFFIHTLRHFTFGFWGGKNIGSQSPEEIRDRFGPTMLFESGPHTVEMELAYSRDFMTPSPGAARLGSISRGGYVLYAFKLSHKWQLVGRYDEWDPAKNDNSNAMLENGILIPRGNHKLKEYTIGINYYIHDRNAKIQLNYIRDDVEENGGGFFGNPRSILLSNFQVYF